MADAVRTSVPSGEARRGILAAIEPLRAATAAQLAEWAMRDASRISLWAPIALGSGAAAYLLAKYEPASYWAPTLFVFSLVAWRLFSGMRVIAAGVMLFSAGFAAADFRAAAVDAPILRREIGITTVRGRLASVDEAPKLRRLVIDVASIDRLGAEETPRRVRLSWRGKDFSARPGDLIEIRASLSPPPPPAAPGGFDFARQLYFQGVGAVGFAVSRPEVLPTKHPSLLARARDAIESCRVTLARRITHSADGDAGAIVAAVVTGKREAISNEAEAAFRDSGLAHLLSISGLHMGLATGLIFFTVRAALALIEPVALTQPIKKWAAIAAMASGFFYLLISGGAWPALRSFIMSSIFFIAILADRRALSLRNVAVAAFLIILIAPEAVLHPGFQMSFAAVTALIAFYEWSSGRPGNAEPSFSWAARLRRYVVAIAVTDTIAAMATAPYSLFHFNRTANFGLAANIISIPLMGFWVMPVSIVALLFSPFGMDGPFWKLAAGGVEIMLALGNWTMGLPGAVTVFSAWPPAALAVITLGGIWLCLMSSAWRLGGLAAMPIAAWIIAAAPHPDIFISENGENAGVIVIDSEGRRSLALFNPRKNRFDADIWMEQSGIDVETHRPLRLSEAASCDEEGCVLQVSEMDVAISADRMGLAADCSRAKLVIATYPVSAAERTGCAAILLDRRDAWNGGAHAITIRNGGIRVESANERRGRRPWTEPPPPSVPAHQSDQPTLN